MLCVEVTGLLNEVCDIFIVLLTWQMYTLQKNELFQPTFGSNMVQPKCWVTNAIKKFTVESES